MLHIEMCWHKVLKLHVCSGMLTLRHLLVAHPHSTLAAHPMYWSYPAPSGKGVWEIEKVGDQGRHCCWHLSLKLLILQHSLVFGFCIVSVCLHMLKVCVVWHYLLSENFHSFSQLAHTCCSFIKFIHWENFNVYSSCYTGWRRKGKSKKTGAQMNT